MSIPSPVSSKIPFADIPRFTKSILPLILLFGSSLVLLVLLIKDVRRSWKRNTHWIPGKRFFLALVLQFLGSLQYPSLSISDERKLEPAVVNELFQIIHKNRVLLLGPMVLLSVVIGIILPQVASSRAQNQKNDIWALFISAFSIVVHIVYQSYIIKSKHWIHGHHKPIYWLLYYPHDWAYKSNLILTVSNCVLLSFLCFVAVTRKRIRKLVAHRIPQLSKPPGRWEEVKEHMLKSWITARTSQPQYIIARSVLSSSTSFIVTLCVGIYVVEFLKNPRLPDLHYMIILISQFSVIISGWLIVCQRCITAVVYNPREVKGLRTYFRLEDFWTRHSPEYGKPKGLVKTMVQKCLVKTMAYSIVIFSKICWLIAQFIFCNRCMVRLIMPMDHDDISKLYSRSENRYEIEKFLPAIMNMPGEDPVRLWIANSKSFQKVNKLLLEGESYAKQCTALISLLKAEGGIDFVPSELEVESGFSVGKRTAKITVVSLLRILIEVFASDGRSSDSPNTYKRTVSQCIKGCTEAWKIMEFVDNKDPGAALVNEEADRLFDGLTKSHMWLGLTVPTNNSVPTTVREARERVEKLAQAIDKEDSWRTTRNSGFNDSMNWTALIATHYLKMVCESILKCPADNMQQMLDAIQSSLADVIRDSVVRLKDRIMVECRLVAEADMEKEEEKLWKVFELAGMAKEILRAAEENVWQDFL